MNMGPPIHVSDEAFPYLRAQKGRLDRLANDRSAWQAAYEADLERSLVEMGPHLPKVCWAMLDIGSGLGGVDVLLYRHYATEPWVNLLDGLDDPPEMKLHRETFSSESVARKFLRSNGVRADRIRYFGPEAQDFAAPYDLVLSLGSWCFHYEPNQYLPRLLAGGGLDSHARVIVDVRKGKEDWQRQLTAARLVPIAIIREAEKYNRMVLQRV